MLWGQRDRILIAADVEEALLLKATGLGGKALRARAMKTIFKDATFIFIYQSLKQCCVARNFCRFNFSPMQRHSLLLKQRKETCSIIVFYYWRAECESEGHDHIGQKKEVNLLESIAIFSEIAILINSLCSVSHRKINYLYGFLKQLLTFTSNTYSAFRIITSMLTTVNIGFCYDEQLNTIDVVSLIDKFDRNSGNFENTT